MNFAGKVLIVDDEPHVRKYVSLVVRTTLVGATILEADNGRAAVAIYELEPADLVLLDVNMPGQDGIATLRALVAIDPDCCVIMLTSLANRRTVEEAAECGATAYLRKDATREEIAATLTEVVSANSGEAGEASLET